MLFIHHFECPCGNNFKKKDEELHSEYCSRCGKKVEPKYSTPIYRIEDDPITNGVSSPLLLNSW